MHPEVCEYGACLGGPVHVIGGPMTLNWNWEFEPIEGVNQIVGHTCGPKVREKSGPSSQNWCIDVHNTGVVGWIENGEFRIEQVYQ